MSQAKLATSLFFLISPPQVEAAFAKHPLGQAAIRDIIPDRREGEHPCGATASGSREPEASLRSWGRVTYPIRLPALFLLQKESKKGYRVRSTRYPFFGLIAPPL